jgi:hypothetical protein
MEEASYELEIFSWVGQHSAGAEGAPKRSKGAHSIIYY